MTIPDVEATFRALADPTRRQILALVKEDHLSAGEIAERFPMTRSAISQHLRVLRQANLVTERRQGTRRLYQLHPETMEAAIAYLRQFWPDRLAELKRQAEREEQNRRGRG